MFWITTILIDAKLVAGIKMDSWFDTEELKAEHFLSNLTKQVINSFTIQVKCVLNYMSPDSEVTRESQPNFSGFCSQKRRIFKTISNVHVEFQSKIY